MASLPPGVDPLDLFDRAPCGYIVTDHEGTIVLANATFLEWGGYEGDDLVGKKRLVDLLTPGGRIYHETHYAPLLRMQGFVREIAVDFVAQDGRRIPAIITATIHRGPTDEDVIRIAILDAADRRGYEQELLRARREAELSEGRAHELARILQASFIPPTAPSIPGLDIGGAFRPAGAGNEVGGDFYDVFEVSEGAWSLVIGDVRGKGAKAATVTALARYTTRAAAIQVTKPRRVLELLNAAMLRQIPDTFCTCAYARMVVQDGSASVTFACGGHPLPILSAADSKPVAVGRPGTLIGVLDDAEMHDATVTLRSGDVLTFFTDGVTEGRQDDDFFGEEKLKEVLDGYRVRPAQEIVDALVDEVVAFQSGRPRDDIAVVAIKVP